MVETVVGGVVGVGIAMRYPALSRAWWEQHEWLSAPPLSESSVFCAPLCPLATIAIAVGLWGGCALTTGGWIPGFCVGSVEAIGVEAHTSAARDWVFPLQVSCVVLAAAALWFVCSSVMSRARMLSAVVFLALAAGVFGASLRARELVTQCAVLPLAIEQESALVCIEGTLLDVPQHRLTGSDELSRYYGERDRWTALIDATTFMRDDGTQLEVPGVCSVVVSGEEPRWRPGDRLSFLGRLKLRSTPANEAESLASSPRTARHAWGSLSVEHPNLATTATTPDRRSPVVRAALAWRASIRAQLRAATLAGMPEGDGDPVRAMLVTLLLGGEEDGSRAVEQRYQVVGLSHILAVSGFNLVVLGVVAGYAARWCCRSTRAQLVLVLLVMLAALFLLAPTASALRAAMMAVIGAVGGLARRDWNSAAILSFAAIIAMLIAPSTAADPGFQLSFAAVLGLRFLAAPLRGSLFPSLNTQPIHILEFAALCLTTAIATSLAATLATLPILLVRFGTIAPYSIIETLLCTPIATLLMAIGYPKMMLGVAWPILCAPLGPVLYWIGSVQNALVDFSLHLPHLGARAISPVPVLGGGLSLLWALTWSIALWVCCRGRAQTHRRIATVSLLSCAFVPVLPLLQSPTDSWFEIRTLSIGDGTSMIIRSGASTVLFDGGSSSSWSVAERVLLPELRLLNTPRVDAAFISHPNLDHFSALLDIARYVGIEQLFITKHFALAAAESDGAPRALLDELRVLGTNIVTLETGAVVRFGNAVWTVLAPDENFIPRNANDSSFVLQIDVDQTTGSWGLARRVLLVGDLETEGIACLLKNSNKISVFSGRPVLAADVFELPHHGSWRTIVPSLLEQVHPTVVLQSTAQRRFKTDRYAPSIGGASRGVTCRDGALRVRVDAQGTLEFQTFDSHQRAWITRRVERRERTSRARVARRFQQARAPPREPQSVHLSRAMECERVALRGMHRV